MDDVKNTFFSWDELSARSNSLALNLRNAILSVDPVVLLGMASKIASFEFVVLNGLASPLVLEQNIGVLRLCEYAQAVLVSACASNVKSGVIDSGRAKEIIDSVSELYKLAVWMPFHSEKIFAALPMSVSQDVRKALHASLIMYNTRGKRDSSFQKDYHTALIAPQDAILKRVYGVTANQVVDGLVRLLDCIRLSWMWYHERANTFSAQAYYNFMNLAQHDEILDMFDVERITCWPLSLIDDLAMGINGGGTFSSGVYAGWPIKDLCIKDRPFIKIDGRYCAFCYYIIGDYFYRALEMAVKRRCKCITVNYEWDKPQCHASENETARLFKCLLPESEVYANNFYSASEKRFSTEENDLLVVAYDAIIIIEVKGGRRWHDSPAEKGHALRINYDDIIKGIQQCRRVEKYLKESDSPAIFDSQWRLKKRFAKLGNATYLIKLVVTIDSANEIASSSETLAGYVGDCTGVICISIDDLMTYEWWFRKHPVLFLSFLKARSDATLVKELFTCDELEHLASFINCPYYPEFATDAIKSGNDFVSMGGLEEVIPYIDARNNVGDDAPRRLPKMPDLYVQLFKMLDETRNKQSLRIATCLLSLPESEKIAQWIMSLIERYCKRRCPISAGIPVRKDRFMAVVVSESFIGAVSHINDARRRAMDLLKNNSELRVDLLWLTVDAAKRLCVDCSIVEGLCKHEIGNI